MSTSGALPIIPAKPGVQRLCCNRQTTRVSSYPLPSYLPRLIGKLSIHTHLHSCLALHIFNCHLYYSFHQVAALVRNSPTGRVLPSHLFLIVGESQIMLLLVCSAPIPCGIRYNACSSSSILIIQARQEPHISLHGFHPFNSGYARVISSQFTFFRSETIGACTSYGRILSSNEKPSSIVLRSSCTTCRASSAPSSLALLLRSVHLLAQGLT